MFRVNALILFTLILLGAVALPAFALFDKTYSPVSQPADYTVILTSKPSPPELGENLLDISIRDPKGKPLQDGQVTLTAAMSGMKMSTDNDAINTENKKNGHYTGKVDLSMGGKWLVTVHIKKGQQPESTAVFEFDIKWE